MTRIDASMIRSFLECREQFRRRYVENIVEKKPAIHLEFGKAMHLGAETFWKGATYEEAFRAAMTYTQKLDAGLLNMREQDRWRELVAWLPDMLALYFEAHDPSEIEQQKWIEKEWTQPYYGQVPLFQEEGIELCGKIDRLSLDNILYDMKTAAAIGSDWIENLRKHYLRDFGLALYDWKFQPLRIIIEVCVKPYKSSRPQIKEIELPEIIAYRARFAQQLKWVLSELSHYLKHYRDAKPWLMSCSACQSKYGDCPYLPLCLYGDSPKKLEGYKPREEHLEVMK